MDNAELNSHPHLKCPVIPYLRNEAAFNARSSSLPVSAPFSNGMTSSPLPRLPLISACCSFPPDNPVAALLASLATFGVGMLVRPLGAAVFGSLADKYGRRPIFIATIVLMGLSTFGVGLLPTYQQVGMLAPALLLMLRLLQGFSVGGEIGGSAVYLTEHAPANRRGIYTSVLQLMGPLGILVSTLQVLLLQAMLSGADFSAWGWRVPFLFPPCYCGLAEEPVESARIAGISPHARKQNIIQCAVARMFRRPSYSGPYGTLVLLYFRRRLAAIFFIPNLHKCLFEKRGQARPTTCRDARDDQHPPAISVDHSVWLAV